MEPLISVIIPTYRREEALKKAISSVLLQVGVSLEVLVCEDGQTKSVASVAKSFMDSRIIYLPGPHVGRPAIPRNRGIAAAKGEWLAFLDDDDEWRPDKLCKQLAIAKEANCLAICSNAYRKSSDGNIQGLYLPEGILPKRISFFDLLNNNCIINSAAVVHSSLVPKIGFIPEGKEFISIEDYAFWLRVATITDFAVTTDGLLNYNDDAQTSIRKYADPRQKEIVLRDYVNWGLKEKIDHRLIFSAMLKMCKLYLLRIKKVLA